MTLGKQKAIKHLEAAIQLVGVDGVRQILKEKRRKAQEKSSENNK